MVKMSGYNLSYVKDQTEEICLEAIKSYDDSLQYVRDQTEAICLASVNQD